VPNPSDVTVPSSIDGAKPPDLVTAVSELQNLLLNGADVTDFLQQVADLAVTVVQAAACGITMRRDHELSTVAASHTLASQVDELQYGRGQGPCLQALNTGEAVSVPNLSHEQRWNGYPMHALAHGVSSSLSLPMRVDGTVIGALNLYATDPEHFGTVETQQATAFANQAATALTIVLRHTQHADLEAQLRDAISNRTVIDHAMGIIMGQQHCTASEAFAVLRAASQHRNIRLHDIAADMIRTVTGHAPEHARPFTERA
jgi:GAF domain-containing protein